MIKTCNFNIYHTLFVTMGSAGSCNSRPGKCDPHYYRHKVNQWKVTTTS